MMDTKMDLSLGYAALRRAEWQAARQHFEAALASDESAEAHDGLGLSLWWLNRIEESHDHRAAAYRLYKQRGDAAHAAWIAAWLAREQIFLRSNPSAMQGWFARADRLARGIGRCAEAAWVTLFRASMMDSPQVLIQEAEAALLLAEECRDPDLEAFALACRGIACVNLGRLREGMGDLDEAMAAVMAGEVQDFSVKSEVFCYMLSACDMAGDCVRTDHWCRVAAEFAERYHCIFLAAYCRTHYGGLLVTNGRWREAEAELVAALDTFETGHRGLKPHALLKLADLRVRQGRLEEAEILLQGFEDHPGAQVPLARLALMRRDVAGARAILESVLRGSLTVDRAPALLLLVDVALAADDVVAARGSAARLRELGQRVESDLILAQADLAEGRIRRVTGDADARDPLQAVLDAARLAETSLPAAEARLEMARLLADTDRPGAITWARAALASFQRIGALHEADETAALLRHLGAGTPPSARTGAELTRREQEVLGLLSHGLTNREIGKRLAITPKTVEHHVGQILSKLGARTRAEAAAQAARSLSASSP